MSTIEFLDRVREAHSIRSDYALAERLGLTRQQVSKYRSRKDYMSDETAARVAELLGVDPGFVLATIHAERSKNDDTRALWVGIAERLQRAGVAALAALCFALPSDPASARTPHESGIAAALSWQSVYYVKRLARAVRRLIHRALTPIWGTLASAAFCR